MGATVEEAVARIEFLINNRRSVGSLIGPSGCGKSTVLRHCHNHPPVCAEVPNLQILRVSMMGLQAGELVHRLASWLSGGLRVDDYWADWKSVCDYFRAAQREDLHTVLLIDDTESCNAAAEADLCRILSMNFPLTVIFSVESQLASAVSRSLIDRVELQVELPPWDYSQTTDYLMWVGRHLGRSEPIFSESAVQRIYQLSGGIVRRISQLSDLALVAGAVSQSNYVDAGCIDQVAWELPKSFSAA
ncbi:MAG TPA: hypothetical protein DCF63_13860 [Planctomycetaceae bacterium]|nr:hypothetical protein [Planctomycetaceae bacterium]